MKTEFIPKVITLFAGAVVCIICIVKDMEVTYSLELLLLTLIIFYIIGCIAKKIIEHVMESNSVMRRKLAAAEAEAQMQAAEPVTDETGDAEAETESEDM